VTDCHETRASRSDPQPLNPAAWGVYLVTDRAQTNGRPLLDVIDAALRAGIRAVQLRERDLSARALLALAEQLRELTWRHGAALLINDRIDIALACGADGVHLPAHSFAVADARALLGPARLIGVSTHAPAEVARAAAAGADFAVLGPICETPSKRAYGPPLGLAALTAARAAARIPLFAIGGMDVGCVAAAREHGADGVAVIRAVLAADDACQAAAALVRAAASREVEGPTREPAGIVQGSE
jgi:thiamine-phosphate pyrophosphorylase